MFNDLKEEIEDTTESFKTRYYINGTHTQVNNDGTMTTYYANGTIYQSIDYDHIREWFKGDLIFHDELINNIQTKKEGGANVTYYYDGSKKVSATQRTFTNGTTIDLISNYEQVSDSFAVRKYYDDGKYEFTIASPIAA